MSTELVNVEGRTYRAMEIRAHVNLIQEVMKAVMVKDVHYGIIPGTPKPSLYKPGAEKLLVTFRIAPDSIVEDLSTEDCARYRVKVIGTSILTGIVVGSGMGECSSDEEKYKWRKPVCNEEWEEMPVDRRREVWKRVQGKPEKVKQIRTSPADVRNTVLKMADKRAYVALALKTTAASDIFDQDIEDIPEEMRQEGQEPTRPPIQQPKPKQAPESQEQPEAQYVTIIVKKIESKQVKKKDGSGTFDALTIHAEGGWAGQVAGFRSEAEVLRGAEKSGTPVKVGFVTDKYGHRIGSAVLAEEVGDAQE